jgi:hypothetical protein
VSSNRDWDPHNVRFTEASRTVEEEIARTIGAVNVESERFETTESMDAPSNTSVSTEAGGLRGNCPLQEVIEKKESTSRST